MTAAEGEVREGLKEWAKAPLEELRFLKRVVEGRPEEGDGFMSDEGRWLKGAVVWAPFHLPESWFQIYLNIAESVAGPMLWERVVGFRYLLQGKEEGEVTKLVGSDEWVENIVSLSNGRGGKGWVFDVGVDIHRDGPGPMEDVGDMIGRVREREAKNGSGNKPVRFVLSKFSITPPFSHRYPHNKTRILNIPQTTSANTPSHPPPPRHPPHHGSPPSPASAPTSTSS